MYEGTLLTFQVSYVHMYVHSFSIYVRMYVSSYLGSIKAYVCTYDTDLLGNRAVHTSVCCMYVHVLLVYYTYVSSVLSVLMIVSVELLL